MKTKILICFFIITAGLSYGQTSGKKNSDLSWRLMLQHRTAIGFHDNRFQKSELKIDPEMTWKINRYMKLFAQIRYYAEFTDNLEPGRNNTSNYSAWSRPILLNNYSQVELRELYLDTKLGKLYWRIGKQQIVWGQTEGIKVLDVLNPMSWREFILDDFDDSRIALWSIKTDFTLGNLKFQGIWIPDLTYHHFPGGGGIFEQKVEIPTPPEGVGLSVKEVDKPDNPIKDSDIGVRIASFIKGWDLSFSYLYHYDDFPVAVRSFSFTDQGSSLVLITPTYKRSSLIGLTFANTIGNFGIRGEVGLAPNKPFTSMDQADGDGIYKSDQLTSGIGLDYFGISETLITFQWFSDIILDVKSENQLDRYRALNYVTLMVSRAFINQKLDAKAFMVFGLDDQDGLLDMKASYLLSDNLKISLTGDVVFGDKKSIIGQFNTTDRIMIGFEFGLQ